MCATTHTKLDFILNISLSLGCKHLISLLSVDVIIIIILSTNVSSLIRARSICSMWSVIYFPKETGLSLNGHVIPNTYQAILHPPSTSHRSLFYTYEIMSDMSPNSPMSFPFPYLIIKCMV